MTDDTHTDENTASSTDTGRRTFLKGVGAGAATIAVGGTAGAAERPDNVDDAFEMDGGPQEALVVFTGRDAVDLEGDAWWAFESLPIAFAELTPARIRDVAAREAVRGVYYNKRIEWDNDDARVLTRTEEAHAGAGLKTEYTGESAHAAVIDTGTDGDHPDLADNLVANWQPVGEPSVSNEPLTWENVQPLGADTDENGHGTHCSGSVAGGGDASEGRWAGHAPDADLTVYSIGESLRLVYSVAAFDHIVTRKRNGETDIQVTSNSYSPNPDGQDMDPFEPMNVASWYAFKEGIVSCFSAGNDGPGESNLSLYGKGPHVLVSPATHDESDPSGDDHDRTVAGFSGRGRRRHADYDQKGFDGPNNHAREPALENLRQVHDHTRPDPGRPYGVYRPDAGTPGNLVMSTLSPGDALQVYGGLSGVDEVDTEPYYGKISGTSMSTPTLAGCVATIIDAYQQHHDDEPDPVDVMNTIQATAKNYHPVDSDVSDKGGSPYTVVNIGPGFIDVQAACERAANGDWASFEEAEANLIDAESV